jgi:hypothetical protein
LLCTLNMGQSWSGYAGKALKYILMGLAHYNCEASSIN